MADISNFFNICHVFDYFKLGFDIILAHIGPRKVPEAILFPAVWAILFVFSAVLGAPGVAKPYVVSFIGQYEGWCLVFVSNNPAVG